MGLDIVAVERIIRLFDEHDGAATALFTSRELDYCEGRRHSPEHFAARFAAKEAVLKAFGTGMAGGMRWTDIEVVTGPGGRPTVELHGAAGELAQARGLAQIDVSLSHAGGLALAQAVAVWR